MARKWIEEAHPGTQTFALELYEGLASLTGLHEQVKNVTAYIANLTSSMPLVFQNGYHIIGHSQGGLLMRCVIENFDQHKVDRFIALAGAINGYYGAPGWLRDIIGDYAPSALTDLLYFSNVQKHFSFADMWKDPTQIAAYFKYQQFLPHFNNEVCFQRVFLLFVCLWLCCRGWIDWKMTIGNTWNYRLKHNDASNCSFWRNISDSSNINPPSSVAQSFGQYLNVLS